MGRNDLESCTKLLQSPCVICLQTCEPHVLAGQKGNGIFTLVLEHHAVKTYGGTEEKVHAFLISTVDVGDLPDFSRYQLAKKGW